MFPLLAFDTTDRRSSVCLSLSDSESYAAEDCLEKGVEGLIPLIDKLLNQHDLSKLQLKTVCCSLGPGSFTGIRTGLAVGLGLSKGLGTRLLAIPVLAARLAHLKTEPGEYQVYLPASKIDSFQAKYKLNETGALFLLNGPEIIANEIIEAEAESWLNLSYSAEKLPSPALSIAKAAQLKGKFGLFDSKTESNGLIKPNYIKAVNAKTLAERSLA